MRNLFFTLLSFILITPIAYALIPVEDIPNEINTRMSYLNSVQSLVKEDMMIQNQLNQLNYEAKNMQGLSGQNWDNADQALKQLSLAINEGNALAYSNQNLDQHFNELYPGYRSSATNNYLADNKSRIEATQSTMNGTLDQLKVSYQQEAQETSVNNVLSSQAKSTSGRMQAIQVGNEIAAEEVAQLEKLKATMMAETNAQAEYAAYQTQKDAAEEQSVDAVVQQSDTEFPAYQNNAQFGLIPSFVGAP